MAAAAAAAAWLSSSRAAATETRVRACACDKANIQQEKIGDQHSPCSVRVHGSMIITRESRKIGDTRSRSEHDEVPPYCTLYDHRTEVQDPSLFRSHASCRDLVHRMLAEGPRTGSCDLAAENWEVFQPRDIATTIVALAGGSVPPYAFDIELDLHVRLIYREPKALHLLLACKDATAARVPGKRSREPAGDLCAVCLSDFLETQEEETITLPCSHAFHRRCIEPWFHRASTCPTCRRDAANGTIRRDDNVDQVHFLETREGNDDDGAPVQDYRPVRARRQTNASGRPSLD